MRQVFSRDTSQWDVSLCLASGGDDEHLAGGVADHF